MEKQKLNDGSAAVEVDVTESKTRCPKCLSIRRSKYHRTVVKNIQGTTREGRSYDRIVWRRCSCSSCGQARIDKAFEAMKGTKKPSSPPNDRE